MSGPDKLYNLRNQFYLGNYSQVQSIGSSLSNLPEPLRVERDAFVFRAHVALREFHVVLDEVPAGEGPPVELRAVRALALYLSNPAANGEAVLAQLQTWLADEATGANDTLRTVAGLVFGHEGQFPAALQVLSRTPTSLEMHALMAQLLIRMDRPDAAEARLKTMQRIDEDATLSQLTAVWVAAVQGGRKCQEAIFALQEMRERFGPTTALLNAAAVCHMHLGQYEEAESLLVDATAGGDPDVLVNVITCAQQRGKPQNYVDRYVNQLRAAAPAHPFVQGLERVESVFDRVAAGYAV